MQVLEFEKKSLLSTRYTLGVTVALVDEATVESEFRHIKEAILQWVASRRRAAVRVLLTIIALEEQHDHIAEFVKTVYRRESELGPVLRSIEFELSLLNDLGEVKQEIQFRT